MIIKDLKIRIFNLMEDVRHMEINRIKSFNKPINKINSFNMIINKISINKVISKIQSTIINKTNSINMMINKIHSINRITTKTTIK